MSIKRRFSFLMCVMLICTLLASCAAQENVPPAPTEEPPSSLTEDGEAAPMRARVIEADETALLLASVETEHPDLYTVSLKGASLQSRREGEAPLSADIADLAAGAMVELHYQTVMETWPARLGGVECITVLPEKFDDRCALYLRVLEELWNADSGLNSDVEYVSVDLSQTSLAPAERSAVAWVFACAHNAQLLEESYEQLAEHGYLSETDGGNAFPHWENGVLFTLREEADAIFNLPRDAAGAVSLHAEKWRSALGAYGFACTAVQSADGRWGEADINSAWIS